MQNKQNNPISRAIITLTLIACAILKGYASDFSSNGLYYNIRSEIDLTVEINYARNISGAFSIPSTVTYNSKTYQVTAIAGDAFAWEESLTSITIPSSIDSIGDNAFKGCTNLNKVLYVAKKCTTMGSYNNPVFSGCDQLTTLIIGANVEYIPPFAFYGCSGLTSVSIPNSVTSIGGNAFEDCTGLTSVTIGNSVTSIGSSAFKGCSGLTEVTIPNSVISIGSYAFDGCSGLTEVTIPNSVTSIGSSAFEGCSGLTSITIPNSVTSIGYSVFEGCSGLKSITIPNSVTSIDSYAFKGCTGLKSITIPNSVTSIGNSAFSVCTGLTSVTIGNSVTSIGNYAFYSCSKLTSGTIPSSVTSIGSSAFKGCSRLSTVNFNATNCTSMGSSDYPVFADCSNFSTLNIGENVTNIPNYAFKGCSRLTTVNFNATNCTSMGSSDYPVFANCSNLSTLNIGENVTNIPNYAFYNSSQLSYVSGGDSLAKSGYNAFWGCDKLVDCTDITTTHTTATISLTTPTDYKPGVSYSYYYNLEGENKNGVIAFVKLKPAYTYENFKQGIFINNVFCSVKSLSSFTTKGFSLNCEYNSTSISAKGDFLDSDATIIEYGIYSGSLGDEYNNLDSITTYNLDPATYYTFYYKVNTEEGGVYSGSKSIKTATLSWSNSSFTATSTSSARLKVDTNADDATEGTGYEWKRYDAPEDLTPNKAPCPVVDGSLVGSLRGLNPNVYYKCRPYYTSATNQTYYGEWMTIFTGDANVWFEPDVRTINKNEIINNTIIVNGYALAGSDEIIEQGFEYWKVSSTLPSPFGVSSVKTVVCSGISMSATISGLEYNSVYRYRAYVKTSAGTYYGSEIEFITGNDPTGIEYIEDDQNTATEVARYDINGRKLSQPSKGINIIKMSDGSTRKEWVKE